LSGDNLFRPPQADFKTYTILLATNILSAEWRTARRRRGYILVEEK